MPGLFDRSVRRPALVVGVRVAAVGSLVAVLVAGAALVDGVGRFATLCLVLLVHSLATFLDGMLTEAEGPRR